MGLLDNLIGTGIDDPRFAATSQLAQGLLSSPRLMQGLAQGVGGYQQAIAQARQQKALEEERQMRLQMQQMQLQQAQAQAAKQKQLEALAGQFARSPQQMALGAEGKGPTNTALAASQTMSPGFDFAGYSQALAGIDPMAALTMQGALRKEGPKFSTAPQYDQNGRAFVLAENGTMRYLDGVSARDKLVSEDLGGRKVFRSEYSATPVGSLAKTQTPDGVASNAVAWANNRVARDRLKLDQESAGGFTYQADGTGQIVALPKRPTGPGPITAYPVQGQGNQGRKDASEALALTARIREILPNATGSMAGNALDYGIGAFGFSTEGGDNASKLRALEGQLVAKMPKMSGPQSDKDAARYVQMAAEVGNANLPTSRRLAALDEVEHFQRIYAGQGPVNQGAQPLSGGAPALRYNPKTGGFD